MPAEGMGASRTLYVLTLFVLSRAAEGTGAHLAELRRPRSQIADGARVGEVAMISSSTVTLPLRVFYVTPADNLVQVLANASAGDEIRLANGTYTPSATLAIDKSITFRALSMGGAVLDGQHTRQVLRITDGNVHLVGLNITGGKHTDVRPCSRPCHVCHSTK
jgi:hypothetical protein